MTVTLNFAGSSAADPILNGLPGELIVGANTFDVASFVDAWIETNATIPGASGSIKSSLSPAATVLTLGLSGTYDDTTKAYKIASTTGLSVGDYLYMSQASLPANFYKIASIVNSTDVTLVSNPLNGLGNKSGISYQVAWRFAATYGTSPTTSGASATINYLKARLQDGVGNNGDLAESFYVQNAPSGAAFVSIATKAYTGQTINTTTPAFNLLSTWANRGGVSHVELVNHSTQARNDFKWGDSTVAEKTIAAAITSGLSLVAGDGIKYGRLNLKSKSGGAVYGIDLDVTLDTTGPTVQFFVAGR